MKEIKAAAVDALVAHIPLAVQVMLTMVTLFTCLFMVFTFIRATVWLFS